MEDLSEKGLLHGSQANETRVHVLGRKERGWTRTIREVSGYSGRRSHSTSV